MEALISSTIPNFVNGVSQQPYTLRLNSQGELQENGLSTVAQGLKKRPPTKHIKKILSTVPDNAFLHTINRDSSEQYVVVVTNGDLKVFDLLGNEKTVLFPEGKGYLAALNPAQDFTAVTVADYTFLVNKTVEVKQNSLRTPKRPFEALVNVKLGNYGKNYKIFINDTQVANYKTPNGGDPSHSDDISTDNIASQLFQSYLQNAVGQTISNITWLTYTRRELVSNTSGSNIIGGFFVNQTLQTVTYYYGVQFDLPAGATVENSTLEIKTNEFFRTRWTEVEMTQISTNRFEARFTVRKDQPTLRSINYDTTVRMRRRGSSLLLSAGADFDIRVEDGFNNNAMLAIKGEAQYFNDLPTQNGFDGFVVKVAGDPDRRSDDYYAKWDSTNGDGVWKETVAPDISIGLFDETMPWVLVRTSDGNFRFYSPEWGQRTVGDLKSAPDPSFVNKKISDVFFYRNRLGFLADESISFSEDGEFFNFYPTTVTALLDTDRIDVTTSHTKVANLRHAVGFNKQLLLFAEQTQFLVEDNDTLTPKNISVKVSTEFPCNVVAKPVGVGKNMYFVADKDGYSQVREYFPDTNDFNYDSLDVTGHIPKYIPSGIFKMTAAPNEDAMVLLSNNERNALYVYKFFWSNTEKLQSSWSRFTLGSEAVILNADFIQSRLMLVVKRPDGVYLESMNFALGAVDGDEPYYVHLDRKVALGASDLTYSNGFTFINHVSLGYLPQYGTYKAVIRSGTGFKPGVVLDVIWDGTNAKIKGNYVGASITVGQVYTFKYVLSPITIKTQSRATGGQRSSSDGRLQIRKIAFNYADSGFFDIKVTPTGRGTKVYTYSGKILGQDSGTIGTYGVSTGYFSVPVVTRNTSVDITLENPSPLPCSFLSADWEGMYVKRSTTL